MSQVWEYEASDDFYAQRILPHVLSGKGCAVLGPPGVGKPRVLTRLAEELKKQGRTVVKIALTHVAAGNIGGQTAHTFALRHVLHGSFKGIVLLDEISLMPLPLLSSGH